MKTFILTELETPVSQEADLETPANSEIELDTIANPEIELNTPICRYISENEIIYDSGKYDEGVYG